MMPDPLPGDIERSQWTHVPAQFTGIKIKSLDELKQVFPKDTDHSEVQSVRDNPKYLVLGRVIAGRYPEYLAYQCKSCKTIVVGPPNIQDDLSIKEGIPLAGREGYDVYCHQCQTQFEEHTFKQS